jgi:phosphatidylinositol alpha-mannosyltransferase
MKIALVSPYDYPYPGGVTEHITHLDEEFRRLGHEVKIIAASSGNQDEPGDHVLKVTRSVTPIPYSGSIARITLSLRAYPRVKKILREEQFDVIHVHEPLTPNLPLFVLRHCKVSPRSVVVGTFHAYRESAADFQYGKPLLRRFIGRLDGRIAVSQAVVDYISHYFPGDYVVIPNGVDVDRFGGLQAEPWPRFTDGRPNILFVGRMEKRKGFRHLIRAFPYVKQEIPEARLLVVGAYSDEDKAPFVRYARQHKLHGIVFAGYASREELPRYYRSCDVFVAPSTGFESFGIVLLEAMAAGKPIVASDIAGYRCVLKDGREGLFVPPEDERALATAIIRLLKDSDLRRRMGEAGREKADEHAWPQVAERILTYYRQLIAKKRRGT